MKYVVAAAVLAATIAPALAAEEVFQGDVFFTTASIESAACAAAGLHQYDYLRTVFRPANADNGPNSQLSIFGPRYASHYTITGHALSGSGNYSGANFTSHGIFYTWKSTFSAASTTPATQTATTGSVFVKVTLHNFLNDIGCTAVLQGTLGLRPGL